MAFDIKEMDGAWCVINTTTGAVAVANDKRLVGLDLDDAREWVGILNLFNPITNFIDRRRRQLN